MKEITGHLGETKYSKEVRFVIKEMDFGEGPKKWLIAELINGKAYFVPSFLELFIMIRMICHIEDEKYDKPWQKGRLMVQDFLWDCCEPDLSWEEIKAKYQLPR